jgi:hypothetical protein
MVYIGYHAITLFISDYSIQNGIIKAINKDTGIMDTKESIDKLIGSTGNRPVYILQNNVFTLDQFEEMLSFYSARQQNRIKKLSKKFIESWTWTKQSTRYSTFGYTAVKSNVKYTELV